MTTKDYKKVLVLGGTGMLGSMLTDVLSTSPQIKVIATKQPTECGQNSLTTTTEPIEWHSYTFDARHPSALKKLLDATEPDYIVNAIGLIKHNINTDSPSDNMKAIALNATFPLLLSEVVGPYTRIIQICTDCVYTGMRGAYNESDRHDAQDIYGKTKSLGELVGDNTTLIRCSIIGPEQKTFKSLLEWFRRQPAHARIKGFSNHQWNGVTTLQFAKLCRGLITNDTYRQKIQHFIPANTINKLDLLRCFASHYLRNDIAIEESQAHESVDRTLATLHPEVNKFLWSLAGYTDQIPTIAEGVLELSQYEKSLSTKLQPPPLAPENFLRSTL
jgi:dTDP-4-dehydrorhamnose reductase